MKFQGETMTCIMSGREQVSDPEVESGWDCIVIGRSNYYVSEQWREASYKKIGVKPTWHKIAKQISALENARKGRK